MKKYGPEKAKLLFTDTDSLTYHIKTDDVYKDMVSDKHLFDFSDYPSNTLKDAEGNETIQIENKDENKKIIGKFKDETKSKPIIEFVGLRSKMYSFKTEEYEKKTAKGINSCVKNKCLNFDDYKRALFEKDKQQRVIQHSFRVEKHNIYSIEQNKRSLAAFDDKKYLINEIESLPFGHYSLPLAEQGSLKK